MSIIERAIQKLQKASQLAPSLSRSAAAPLVATRVRVGVPVPAAQVSRPTEPRTSYHRTVPLDINQLRRQGLIPLSVQERELAAQYRHIKRPLVAMAISRGSERLPHGNSIMVTSALPGEGKSFTSLNLALSIALEQDLRVLLVDADVPRPRLSREFGLEGEPGLIDALRDQSCDVESLIVGTDNPSLAVLPAGSQSDTATELLAGARMAEVVSQLCENDPNRIVLFDSPPVLPTTEARVLTQVIGQVVLVVRCGRTPQKAVLEALHLMLDPGVVNLVLTHADKSGAGSYYYGHYKYGEYGAKPEPDQQTAADSTGS